MIILGKYKEKLDIVDNKSLRTIRQKEKKL